MTTPRLHLRLLGHPELRHEQEILKCNTSSLRLLAVLALDGPQDRLTLADLLWDIEHFNLFFFFCFRFG